MGQHIHEYFISTITLLKGLRSQLHCTCLEQRCHLNMAAVDSLSLSLSPSLKQASKQTFANANCLPKIKMSYWNFAKYRSCILHARVQHPREKANIQGTCTITRIFALAKKRLLKHLLLQIPSCPPLHLPGRVCSPVLFTASVCLATYGVSKDKWSSYDQVHVDTRVRSLIHQNSTIVHMRLDF